ncbi:MAG: arylsulfatase A-like enzyme [Verrucomicrobiales bacterium]|jgi:arylsulfatase A-like enzyme
MRKLHLLALLIFAPLVSAAADKPNILWLSAEDISAHLGCYGDPHAITPNLDKLASEGRRFTHAFTAAGVCAPCRSTIITGMYQPSIGTHHMRCKATLPDFVKPFPLYLREAGYFCTNNSKTDYQFGSPSPREIWDESSNKAHWKNRDADQPFFAVFNYTGCHESGIASKGKYESVTKDLSPEQRQDPAKLTTLPPYYPDTPIVREDWKRNYELITAMDAWAGEHIAALKEAGLYENTIVIFWSDHGVGLPRAKRWLYDSGTHIPMISRIPGDEAGVVDSQLVSSIDFGPTVLNLAGVPVPEHMQGRAFLGENLTDPREYVFGARDRMDERYDIIRAVRGPRFRYIRNFEPLKPYYQYMNTPEKGETMREIRRIEASGEVPEHVALFTAATKPVEEFYDLENDPHEINNLAEDPKYADQITEMRQVLADWQASIGDIGLLPESEITIRTEAAGSSFEILNREGGEQALKTLVEAATIASDPNVETAKLAEGLDNEDAAVRYWAATGLGNRGMEAAIWSDFVHNLQLDPSPSVRIAASWALCRMGKADVGVPVLAKELEGERQWARLQAAIALDEIGEDARPAIPALQAALKKQPNKYIVRVANKALNDLLGTTNTVP